MTPTIPALTATTSVPVPPEQAYQAFVEAFDGWWPAEFTWSQAAGLERMIFGTQAGDLLSEIGPHGFRIDWGRVVAAEPPRRVEFTWQISPDRVPVPDPEQASMVRVAFEPDGDATTVTVTHDGWDRHGPDAASYREQFSPAWDLALAAYAQHVAPAS